MQTGFNTYNFNFPTGYTSAENKGWGGGREGEGSRDVMVVRALASNQSSPGSNPGCGVILEVG